jgi:hypothetical protein
VFNGSGGTDFGVRNGSPAAGADRRQSGWCDGALRCLGVEESGEKLEFAVWGRKHGRGGVGGLIRRENRCGGGPSWSGDGTLMRHCGHLPRAARMGSECRYSGAATGDMIVERHALVGRLTVGRPDLSCVVFELFKYFQTDLN